MRQDLWIREGDIDGGKGIDVDQTSSGRVAITLGTYSNGVTLFMESDDALTIAHRILYVLRGDDETTEDDAPTIANRLWDALRGDDKTTETAEAPEATAPVCDNCGAPVVSDGDTGNEWWRHAGGLGLYGREVASCHDRTAEVAGSHRVKDSVTNETPEAPEATAPVCDVCGKPVESDGDTGNEWWKHVDESLGYYNHRYVAKSVEVTVNGSKHVKNSVTNETTEAPEATAPVCDVCGEPVESDGDTGNEWWQHVDESLGTYQHLSPIEFRRVEVEGSRRVKDSVTK